MHQAPAAGRERAGKSQGRAPGEDVTKQELETLLDCAAAAALRARARIEAAVEAGELPAWLLEACNEWERAALVYGAARAQLQALSAAEGSELPAIAPPAAPACTGKPTKN